MTGTIDADSGVTETEAVIDNGSFGKRTIGSPQASIEDRRRDPLSQPQRGE